MGSFVKLFLYHVFFYLLLGPLLFILLIIWEPFVYLKNLAFFPQMSLLMPYLIDTFLYIEWAACLVLYILHQMSMMDEKAAESAEAELAPKPTKPSRSSRSSSRSKRPVEKVAETPITESKIVE